MDDVVAELRERLARRSGAPSAFDRAEDSLRKACLDGTGHVLLTGTDRGEIDEILSRVLVNINALSAVRTRATDADPYATVDRVIASFDSDTTPDNYLDRRAALLGLLARAEKADKSIFIVVDDADHASIEQLERLRTSLEIAPAAIERLRLVLVGDVSLPQKLDDTAARALRTRITSCVKIDDPAKAIARKPPLRRKTAGSHALTLAVAAAVTFCAVVYSTYFVGFLTGGKKAFLLARRPNTESQALASAYALRGNEPFLDTPLRIAMASTATKRAAAPARKATASAPKKIAQANPKSAQPTPSRGSSIDTLMQRFR